MRNLRRISIHPVGDETGWLAGHKVHEDVIVEGVDLSVANASHKVPFLLKNRTDAVLVQSRGQVAVVADNVPLQHGELRHGWHVSKTRCKALAEEPFHRHDRRREGDNTDVDSGITVRSRNGIRFKAAEVLHGHHVNRGDVSGEIRELEVQILHIFCTGVVVGRRVFRKDILDNGRRWGVDIVDAEGFRRPRVFPLQRKRYRNIGTQRIAPGKKNSGNEQHSKNRE